MKSILKSFIIVPLVIIAAAGCKTGGHHWSYEGESGPANWGHLCSSFSACKDGKSQSPINITGPFEKSGSTLEFKYSDSILKVINNGHTIQVNYSEGSSLIADGKEFKLLQFHFHTPSEDAINGKHADMCVHIVQKSEDGELAVVGVYLNKGAENSLIKTIWENIPDKAEEERSLDNIKINISKLLPAKKSFYSYSGSLTTPPCTEGVNWYILAEPVTVSKEQIEKFISIYPKNARPIQNLNNRKIRQGS